MNMVVEFGGTNINYLIYKDNIIIHSHSFLNLAPKITLNKLIKLLSEYKVDKLAIGAFGPIAINTLGNGIRKGTIYNSPKVEWNNINLLDSLDFSGYLYLTTDVNLAAIGEYKQAPTNTLIYITIGTGVGVSILVNGKPIEGSFEHCEGGHVSVSLSSNEVNSVCPIHSDCLEGVASGKAIQSRITEGVDEITSYDISATYVAKYLSNLFKLINPNKVILGGGVGRRLGYIEAVNDKLNNEGKTYNYLNSQNQVVLPACGDMSAIKGGQAVLEGEYF